MIPIENSSVIAAIKSSKMLSEIGELDENLSFKDQGIDSLDVSTMLLAVEEVFGIAIPDADIDQLTSIPLITAYIKVKKGCP